MPPGIDDASVFLFGVIIALSVVLVLALRKDNKTWKEWQRLNSAVDQAREDFPDKT